MVCDRIIEWSTVNLSYRIIGRFSPRQEIYSIDERFADFSEITEDLTTHSQKSILKSL